VTKFRKAGLAALVVALGGCEYLDATKGVEPPPAEGRPFPNLASVPIPAPPEPAAERKTEVEQLTASRDASIKQDQQIRALNPGSALPPPRPRTAQPAPPRPGAAAPPAPDSTPAEPLPPRPQASTTMPRPQLSSSLFMGTVVPTAERGPLADFQRKVLQDSVAMAQRTNGRIRLVGGRSEEERQAIIRELTGLGLAAGRVTAAPDRTVASRAGIDVLVEN
jgi:hypothetical protein